MRYCQPSLAPSRQVGVVWGLLGILTIVAASGPAPAYVLYDNGASDWVVGSDNALRWSPEVWPSDATLLWHVEDAPEWPELFGSSEALSELVEDGLSDWSEIATADIQWEVAGLASANAGGRDFTNQVFLRRSLSTLGRDQATFGGFMTDVHVWFALDTSGTRPVWQLTECDVSLDQSRMEEAKTDFPDFFPSNVRQDLSRAFRTCLGLGESGPLPGSRRIRESALDSFDAVARRRHTYDSPWYRSAVFGSIHIDQWTGASLLRPRAGWLPTVGSVSGSLSVAGEPVAYAQVWALRHETAGTGPPIGAYSNRSGEFLIEGLEPGNYLLWAHPASYRRLGTFAPLAGATTDVRDAGLLGAVRVRAGRVTSGISIPMEAGRH